MENAASTRKITPDGSNVIMQAVELPEAASSLDHLGLYNNLPGLPEGTREWLWRFPICVGTFGSCETDELLRHVDLAASELEKDLSHVTANYLEHYDGPNPHELPHRWISALTAIKAVARGCGQARCWWFRPIVFSSLEIAEGGIVLPSFDDCWEKALKAFQRNAKSSSQ